MLLGGTRFLLVSHREALAGGLQSWKENNVAEEYRSGSSLLTIYPEWASFEALYQTAVQRYQRLIST
jgi:hypothetical protein